MRKSPITVQEWVDALPQNLMPPTTPNAFSISNRSLSKPSLRLLGRDVSVQSDDGSSHCSSVESVLELRRPDPEAVLLGLGFGPPHTNNKVTRIPQRFLQPSKLLKNIDLNKFLEQHGELRFEQGYSSAPPSPARSRPKTC